MTFYKQSSEKIIHDIFIIIKLIYLFLGGTHQETQPS